MGKKIIEMEKIFENGKKKISKYVQGKNWREKIKMGKKIIEMEKIFENGKKKYQNMYKVKIGGGHIECPFSRKGQGGL